MPRQRPPQLAETLLLLLLPRSDRSSIVGDLEELFVSMQSIHGRGIAARSYWKEALVTILYAVRRAIEKQIGLILSLVLGVGGGAGLIATTLMSRRGSLVLLVYAAMMLLVALSLAAADIEPFRRRFALVLTAFMTMTLVLYVFVAASPDVHGLPLWGHAWRIGFCLALGSLTSLIVAAFSSRRSSPFLIFPVIPILALVWLDSSTVARPQRMLFQAILPFTILVNWRRDGWGWAFAGLDVCLWAAMGLLLFQLWRGGQSGNRDQLKIWVK